MENEIQILQTPKGIIEYRFIGNGPTILFSHGGHNSCSNDYKFQHLLDDHFSILIPTRPGYKRTSKEIGKTAEENADMFKLLLDHLGIEQVIIIGVSAGGPSALEFSRKYASSTKKLLLESAVIKPWFHKLTYQYYGVKIALNSKWQKKFWNNMKLKRNNMKKILKTLKIFTKFNPKDVLNNLSNTEVELLKNYMFDNDSGSGFMLDIEHRAKRIDKITVPTLIIHSKNDGTVSYSHAEYAHKKISNSELFSAQTDSHFIYIGPGSEDVLKKRLSFILS